MCPNLSIHGLLVAHIVEGGAVLAWSRVVVDLWLELRAHTGGALHGITKRVGVLGVVAGAWLLTSLLLVPELFPQGSAHALRCLTLLRWGVIDGVLARSRVLVDIWLEFRAHGCGTLHGQTESVRVGDVVAGAGQILSTLE